MTPGVRALFAVSGYLVIAAVLKMFGPYARVAVLAGRPGLPEERPGVSTAAVSIFLGRIGTDGRALYQQALVLDFALPIVMGLAAWATIKWARAQIVPATFVVSILGRVAILAVAAEVIENGLLLLATARYPLRPLLGAAIGTLVTVKFALILLTGIALLTAAALTILRTRRTPEPR
jgi:hypothetical protein